MTARISKPENDNTTTEAQSSTIPQSSHIIPVATILIQIYSKSLIMVVFQKSLYNYCHVQRLNFSSQFVVYIECSTLKKRFVNQNISDISEEI